MHMFSCGSLQNQKQVTCFQDIMAQTKHSHFNRQRQGMERTELKQDWNLLGKTWDTRCHDVHFGRPQHPWAYDIVPCSSPGLSVGRLCSLPAAFFSRHPSFLHLWLHHLCFHASRLASCITLLGIPCLQEFHACHILSSHLGLPLYFRRKPLWSNSSCILHACKTSMVGNARFPASSSHSRSILDHSWSGLWVPWWLKKENIS